MKITIRFPTPTINHLYWHRGNMKFLKKEARELRDEIITLVNNQVHEYELKHLKDKQLIVNVEVHENWFDLNKNIKRKDILNKEKFLIDSVFKGLDLDDRQIFDCRFIKRQSNNEEDYKSIITIREYISELQT